MFYGHDDEYIPLKIILENVFGYYNDYKDNGKIMNFKLDGDSLNKIYDLFEQIEEKLKTDLSDFTSQSIFQEYLRTKVSNEACFRIIKPI